MPPSPVRIGPFDLLEPVGMGATGEVWRGVHREHGIDVAVKVLPPPGRQRGRLERIFHNEIRQAARLDHPRIVVVLDFGTIRADAAEASGGQLRVGSRYIAMEYASGGSLDRHPPAGWRGLRGVLRAVLEALAHAHARGVVHRDIKPGNILLAGPQDLRPGVRLTDFGIAHAWEERAGQEPIPAGTAAFMAPEQARGAGRAQGPWTDLYALGCVGWWMACGAAPYGDANTDDVLRAHLLGDLPPFSPQMDLPQGFSGWLARLLARRPADRFGFAADALFALDTVDRPAASASASVGAPTAQATALTYDAVAVNTLPLEDFGDVGPEPPLPPLAEPTSITPAATTLPPWRSPGAQRPPLHLVGAGLNLLGLRALPLVGRDAELHRLWDALHAVVEERDVRVVLVEGPPGIGKSALTRAAAERAAELGVARVLAASHAAIPTPADGLPRLFARHLGCVGLTATEIEGRLGTIESIAPGVLQAVGRDALIALLRAGSGAPRSAERRASTDRRQRFGAMLRLLRYLTEDRPAVLLLDDVHHGSETLAFVEWLARQGGDRPAALLLLTARPGEGVAVRPALGDAIAGAPLVLGPLSDDGVRDLLAALLPLRADLAGTLIDRVEGNPLLAVELVGGQALQGLLLSTPDGFALRPGATPVLPRSVQEAWQSRLDSVLAAWDDPVARAAARQALALAAALGRDVDAGEWREAAQALSPVVAPSVLAALQAALLDAGLLEATASSLRFTHNLFRDALLQQADHLGRLSALHRACAAMLARRKHPRLHVEARIGRHLVAAGAYAEALQPLSEGLAEALLGGDLAAADGLLSLHRRSLDALGDAVPARAHAEHDLTALKLALWRGQFADADALAARLLPRTRAKGWHRLTARALRWHGMVGEKRGELDAARSRFEEAQAEARAAGDPGEEAASIEHLGSLRRRRGDPEGALVALREALSLNRSLGAREREADCLKEIGAALVVQGRFDEAATTLRRASELYDEAGYRVGRMQCLNNLGDARRHQGRLDEAEVAYRAALRIAADMGSHFTVVIRANLGLARLEAGRLDEARATLQTSLDQARAAGRRGVAVYLHLGLLACAGAEADWAEWQRHLVAARALLEALGISDPELNRLAALASRHAREHGDAERASAALALVSAA